MVSLLVDRLRREGLPTLLDLKYLPQLLGVPLDLLGYLKVLRGVLSYTLELLLAVLNL